MLHGLVSTGPQSASLVHPREVFGAALRVGAGGLPHPRPQLPLWGSDPFPGRIFEQLPRIGYGAGFMDIPQLAFASSVLMMQRSSARLLRDVYRDTVPDPTDITKFEWQKLLSYLGASEEEIKDVRWRMGGCGDNLLSTSLNMSLHSSALTQVYAKIASMLFRGMLSAEDNLPQVGPSGKTLGVRVPEDIAPDANDDVRPGIGGMSVAPSSMWDVPHFRRPRSMGRGASAPEKYCVFGLEEDALTPHPLGVRPDPHSYRPHAFIEPSETMQLATYEAALTGTRRSWRQVFP